MAFDQLQSVVATLASDIASGPIVPTVAPHEIRGYLGSRYDFTKPMALDDVTADVERMMRKWQVQVTHPRYFGLFNPSVTLASVIADTLVAMYNPQLAAWRTSPAANEIERHTLAWLTAKFGLPATTSASFTTGGAEANLSAVIVALTRAFPEYGEGGLRSLSASPTDLPDPREAHDSFNKIAHMTGIGRAGAAHGRDRPRSEDGSRGSRATGGRGSAERARAGHGRRHRRDHGRGRDRSRCRIWRGSAGRRSCGFTSTRRGAAPAILSPRLRGHLAGIDAADSITCDAHKWFSVPMGAGMFFCRHPDAVGEAFRAQTSYMPGQDRTGRSSIPTRPRCSGRAGSSA